MLGAKFGLSLANARPHVAVITGLGFLGFCVSVLLEIVLGRLGVGAKGLG